MENIKYPRKSNTVSNGVARNGFRLVTRDTTRYNTRGNLFKDPREGSSIGIDTRADRKGVGRDYRIRVQ